MLRNRAQLPLHEPAGGFLRVAERFLDRGAVVGLHPLEDRLPVVLVEILDQRDRVIGIELPGDVRDLLRLQLVEQVLADEIVHLGEHVGTDDSRERLHQPVAFVATGELDQVGDVGGMERRDQLARGLVVAGFDGVEHLLDEVRPQPVLLVHHRILGIRQGRGGDVLALAHVLLPRLDPVAPSYGRGRSGATTDGPLNRPPDEAFTWS